MEEQFIQSLEGTPEWSRHHPASNVFDTALPVSQFQTRVRSDKDIGLMMKQGPVQFWFKDMDGVEYYAPIIKAQPLEDGTTIITVAMLAWET